jgi:hypothetical protein
MDLRLRTERRFEEGMRVADLRQNTSINFINTLRQHNLIQIDHKGEIRLTEKGKIATKMGVDNYLRLEKVEKEFLDEEILSMKIEQRGLLLIFGGMIISLLLIIGFWALQLETI